VAEGGVAARSGPMMAAGRRRRGAGAEVTRGLGGAPGTARAPQNLLSSRSSRAVTLRTRLQEAAFITERRGCAPGGCSGPSA